ncbi:hypothetical protein QEN19_003015 [Hanseniaspora menglaensis]
MIFTKYTYPSWEELPYFNPETENKVAIVLHGDKKCGYHISKHLFKHGVKVYIACRSTISFEMVKQKILSESVEEETKKSKSTNSKTITDYVKSFGQIKHLCIDLTDLENVYNSCLYFKEKEKHLDLLIDSGGGYIASSHFTTKDGYEIQLQTNYVAQVLIIFQLIDLIDSCSGSILSISSFLHFLITNPPKNEKEWSDELSSLNRWPNFIFCWFRFAMAKTFMIQFLTILSIKRPNINYCNINVGILMDPSIYIHLTRLPIIGIGFWLFFQMIEFLFGVDEIKSSKSVLKIALNSLGKKSTTIASDTKLAKYCNRGGEVSKSSSASRDLDCSTVTWIETVHSLRDRGYVSVSKL